MKQFEVTDYGTITEKHSAIWLCCTNLDKVNSLAIGEGVMGIFRSCGMTSKLYVLRVEDAVAELLV
jgi:hypothetical protein